MKLPALSFPRVAVTLLAGSHLARVTSAQSTACEGVPNQHLDCPAPPTVALTPPTHAVTSTLLKAAVTGTTTDLITQTFTITDLITRTFTITDLITRTFTVTFTTACQTPALILYSPYKDTSISMNWNTHQVSTDVSGSTALASVEAISVGLTALTFAYATGECGRENWGGVDGAAFAQANVADWSNAGLKFMLSTGGEAGVFTCGSDVGMETFLSRFASSQLEGVDFSIVAGQSQSVINDLVARVKVSQSAHPNLRFSFTLATLGGNVNQSLNEIGQLTISAIQNAGLTNYYINLLAMDYGPPSAAICTLTNGRCDMGLSAIAAANNLHYEYKVPYNQIELTVMIGGNDDASEVFTLNDADTVAAFVLEKGLGGLHFWSFDRDVDCPPGAPSPTCNNYGSAGTLGFTKRFLSHGL